MKIPILRFTFLSVLSACLFVLPYILYRVVRPKSMRAACAVRQVRLSAILFSFLPFICVYLCSSVVASPQPSTENNVHFCLPLNLEDMQARDSIYAATKHALNLNVGEPRTVRMIYFLPNDRPFRQEVVDRIKVAIRQIQTFYAEQMQAHGYGNKTFRFETDAQSEPLVHRVDGQNSDSHYLDNTSATVREEIGQVFDLSANNVYLIVIDNSIDAIGGAGQRVSGVGGGRRNSGFALVSGGFSWTLAAHELGHAFGLSHDFRDDAYIMSYGGGQRRSLSACNAEFLIVHPYFSPDIPTEKAQSPTIELISSPTYPIGAKSVPIQLKVSDPDGLHQILLFVRTREPHSAAGGSEVKSCRGLMGAKDAVVEFEYDGVIPSAVFSSLSDPPVHPIFVEAVDSGGNVSRASFVLSEISPYHIGTLVDHTGLVTSVSFSSDGTTLASAGGVYDGTVRLWDVGTKENIATFKGHTDLVASVSFSPSGKILASGAWDNTVKLWDIATRENIATLRHMEAVYSVVFSPDGTTLASAGGGYDGTVRLWDVETRESIATLRPAGLVTSVSFSPDGTILASGASDTMVRLWDVGTRENIVTISGHTGSVYSIAFSPDGTTLASVSEDGTIKLWAVSEWIRPRPRTLVKISGDNQPGTPGMELANPFVVEVKDQYDNPLPDVQVTFTVAAGEGRFDGRFTVENTATDAKGRAESRLTLGSYPGTNRVEVSVSGLDPLIFQSVGIGTPTIMSGDYRTWHLPDGAIIRIGKGILGGSDRAVAFSPDGQRLAVAGGFGVWLYDVATLRELVLFSGHTLWVTAVAFSPDGTMVASGSSDRTVKIWDITTGRTIATLEGHTDKVSSVVFSLDGKTLASGSGLQVKLWDIATKQHIVTLVHTHPVRAVDLSPDGTMLASGSWNSSVDVGTVWLWDMATRRHIATLEGHTGGINSIVFSPKMSTLVSGSDDGTIKLWDIAARTNIATLKGHTGAVYSVTYSSDGKTLASGAADYASGTGRGQIKLWDVATQRNIATLKGHIDWITSVAFSPDGTTLVSGGYDGVKLWDVLTQNVSTLEGHSRNVFFLSFSSDGTMLAAGIDRMVKVWNVHTGSPIATFAEHTNKIRSVAFLSDGITLASASYDNTIKLWDIPTGRNIATFAGPTKYSRAVVFSPDGTTLVSWRDLSIQLWDVVTGRAIATLRGHTSWISFVVFSPDGTMLASRSDDNTVKLWDISTGRNIVTIEGHRGQVQSVAFSPDGTILASREHNGVNLWDIATGRNITNWYRVYSMVFSPDGTMLAFGGKSGIVELREVSTGRNIATLEGHTRVVNSVVFSPDGTTLASESWDNTVKLWDVMTGRTIATFEHPGVSSIMFSPDGMLLASRSSDGTVLLWDMSLYITSQTPNPDFNGDGQVDLSDFLLFASQFGLSRGDEQYDAKYDLDGDGTIGFGDFLIFGRSFGKEGS